MVVGSFLFLKEQIKDIIIMQLGPQSSQAGRAHCRAAHSATAGQHAEVQPAARAARAARAPA
jgi:hypothetical protein